MTFLDEIMPHLKGLVPDLKKIHYWSDSPSSQYRNRFIFDMVANHKELHGVDARWNFFESGHGKGPCDGLGGTCKRMADNAVNSGKCLIQDALSFHEWALDSGLKMNFIFVASTKCMENDENMAREKIKTIKGTMKTHVVCAVGQGLSRIAIKTVSCYCDSCLSGKMCDSDWSEVATRIIDPVEPTVEQTRRGPAETTPGESISIPSHNQTHVACDVGAFVAAIYSAKWYIWKIVDSDENEVEVLFMEIKKGLYQWPRREDRIWVDKSDVICSIKSPVPTGKSQRMFRVDASDLSIILALFNGRQWWWGDRYKHVNHAKIVINIMFNW